MVPTWGIQCHIQNSRVSTTPIVMWKTQQHVMFDTCTSRIVNSTTRVAATVKVHQCKHCLSPNTLSDCVPKRPQVGTF